MFTKLYFVFSSFNLQCFSTVHYVCDMPPCLLGGVIFIFIFPLPLFCLMIYLLVLTNKSIVCSGAYTEQTGEGRNFVFFSILLFCYDLCPLVVLDAFCSWREHSFFLLFLRSFLVHLMSNDINGNVVLGQLAHH